MLPPMVNINGTVVRLVVDIDDRINYSGTELKYYVPETRHSSAEEKLRTARLENDELYRALDMATDLLPVPEHAQDDEWREKEREVVSIFMQRKFARDTLAKLGDAEGEAKPAAHLPKCTSDEFERKARALGYYDAPLSEKLQCLLIWRSFSLAEGADAHHELFAHAIPEAIKTLQEAQNRERLLLDALEKWADSCADCIPGKSDPYCEICGETRALIAKAEGK